MLALTTAIGAFLTRSIGLAMIGAVIGTFAIRRRKTAFLVGGLVSLLGGTLLVESVVELGTCVTVRLPVDCRTRKRGDSSIPPIETAARLATLTAPAANAQPPATSKFIQEKKIA